MVVMGNPPYAVSSSNKGKWIQNLVNDYKKNLNEKKINLDDDYIKFIRYGQHYIDKNGEGILAYISNNSFIDGITHRQMRKSLLESFDKIYILDLHGNNKKKEAHPDGSKDENVFDIMQGVSINIFVKTKPTSKKLAEVYHSDLYGRREAKYNFLNKNSLKSIKWVKLDYTEPNYFFVYKDFKEIKKYKRGFITNEFFNIKNSGIQTKCDDISIKQNLNELKKNIEYFLNEDIEKLKAIFSLKKESSGWNFLNAKNDLLSQKEIIYKRYNYRPFDFRHIVYTGTSSGFLGRSRQIVSKHFINNKNLGLCLMKQFFQDAPYSHCLITDTLIDERTMYSNRGGTYLFPLYLYPDKNTLEDQTRTPNFNLEIVKEIEEKLKLKFTNEKEEDKTTFAPIDILDYIYAILHSPNYRETYKEFLKIDFPRVPYPRIDTFWKLVDFGGRLRALHLMEDNSLSDRIIDIEGEGDMMITNKLNKKDFCIEDNKVTLKLNDEISIINIPLIAWEFYIGGYQPAQKWLKDRVGKELSRTDLKHYNKIINALVNTDKTMKEIDKVLVIKT